MRFQIDGKTYTSGALDSLRLSDLMVFDAQAEAMGIAERWNDIEDIGSSFADMTSDDVDRHPKRFLLLGVMIWAARRNAGETVTLNDAVSFEIKDLNILPDPEDRKGKAPGAKKPPKGSGQAESPPADGE